MRRLINQSYAVFFSWVFFLPAAFPLGEQLICILSDTIKVGVQHGRIVKERHILPSILYGRRRPVVTVESDKVNRPW